ncbi:MAG: 2'-5' RNA ligase family protein [Acidimicrobiales bacterium]
MGEPVMRELSRHHATVFVTGRAAEHIEPLRREWDPRASRQIDAHVTVAYPEEAPDPVLLRARLGAAAARIPPFPLRLGPVVAHENKPARGVYHLVEDPAGMFAWLREFVLSSPFVPLHVVPHASIVHPRTSRSGPKAYKVLAGDDPRLEFRVGAVHLTAFDGARWIVTESFALSQGPLPDP